MENPHIRHQNSFIKQQQRQRLLKQRPHLFWLTGLSGAGKSTIAHAVEERLYAEGRLTYVFDGDNVRHGLCKDLDFTPQGRAENIRRIAEMCKLFLDAGIICFAAFISPMRADRELVRTIVGKEYFSEVFIKCPLDVCEKRDVKGNYKKARQGLILNYTGISAPYEHPINPDICLDTSKLSLEACIDNIFENAVAITR